jgi:hypothetical protein
MGRSILSIPFCDEDDPLLVSLILRKKMRRNSIIFILYVSSK